MSYRFGEDALLLADVAIKFLALLSVGDIEVRLHATCESIEKESCNLHCSVFLSLGGTDGQQIVQEWKKFLAETSVNSAEPVRRALAIRLGEVRLISMKWS